MKRHLIFFISLLVFIPAIGQQKDSINNQIVAYKLFYDNSSSYRVPIDTSIKHYQIYNPAFSNFTLNSYNGNLGSPIRSNIAGEEPKFSDFMFDQYTRYNFIKPENIKYYNVRSPYTLLTYFTGGPKSRQEQKLDILHTQNVNEKLNVGFLGQLSSSDGEFNHQKVSKNCFSLFSSYDGDRYSYHFMIASNSYKTDENGGVLDSLYENLTDVKPITVPVALQAANSNIKNLSIFLQHRFFVTGSYNSHIEEDSSLDNTEKSNTLINNDSISLNTNDSSKIDSILINKIPPKLKSKSRKWNEVLSFIHELNYELNSRTYSDDLSQKDYNLEPERNYYNDIYIDSTLTKDSTRFRRFENTVYMAINANPIFKIPAELRIGLRNEMDALSYSIPLDSLKENGNVSYWNRRKTVHINTALVGTLANRISKTLSFGVSTEIFFTGYKSGNIRVYGDLSKTIGNNFKMTLSGDFSLEKPGYFFQDFESNHFVWHNKFSLRQSSNLIKAQISHEKLKLYLEGFTGTYINYYYLNSLAMPEVSSNPISIYMVSLKKYVDAGIFHTMFKATVQQSTNNNITALPAFSGYNTSYIEFQLVKNVLRVQLGYDLFYNSAYYAKAYMPATGMYYVQNEKKTGNYPYTDMFLNMKLKRVRFSIKYENFTSILKLPKQYFIPHYPFNPGIIKFGVSWTFYD